MNHHLFRPFYNLLGLPDVGAYGTFLILSFLFAFFFFLIYARRFGFNTFVIISVSLPIIPLSIIGARVFHVFFDERFSFYLAFIKTYGLGKFLIRYIFSLNSGGLVFYGGLLFGGLYALFVAYFVLKDRCKILAYLDLLSLVLAFGVATTRIGCFFNGCCYGIPSDTFGVHFPVPSLTTLLLTSQGFLETPMDEPPPLIPTQLIHSFVNYAIFLYLFFRFRSSYYKSYGEIAWRFGIFYSVGRFLIEFLRFDPRGHFLFLSTSQWWSLFLIFVAFYVKSLSGECSINGGKDVKKG